MGELDETDFFNGRDSDRWYRGEDARTAIELAFVAFFVGPPPSAAFPYQNLSHIGGIMFSDLVTYALNGELDRQTGPPIEGMSCWRLPASFPSHTYSVSLPRSSGSEPMTDPTRRGPPRSEEGIDLMDIVIAALVILAIIIIMADLYKRRKP